MKSTPEIFKSRFKSFSWNAIKNLLAAGLEADLTFFKLCKILKQVLLFSNFARSNTQFSVVEQALNLEL